MSSSSSVSKGGGCFDRSKVKTGRSPARSASSSSSIKELATLSVDSDGEGAVIIHEVILLLNSNKTQLPVFSCLTILRRRRPSGRALHQNLKNMVNLSPAVLPDNEQAGQKHR